LGGDHFTRVIVQQVQKQYHCQIGWQTAEKVKISLGFGQGLQQNKKMVVRGRDILTSLPATIQVSAEDFMAGYQLIVHDLLQHIADLFQDAPPEVMAEGLDQGVMFTGGGSLLTGLADAVESHLRSPIHVSTSALEDVVKGLL
jgi:rod shape-determining protein MreB